MLYTTKRPNKSFPVWPYVVGGLGLFFTIMLIGTTLLHIFDTSIPNQTYGAVGPHTRTIYSQMLDCGGESTNQFFQQFGQPSVGPLTDNCAPYFVEDDIYYIDDGTVTVFFDNEGKLSNITLEGPTPLDGRLVIQQPQ